MRLSRLSRLSRLPLPALSGQSLALIAASDRGDGDLSDFMDAALKDLNEWQ